MSRDRDRVIARGSERLQPSEHRVLARNIIWRRDADAREYQVPCRGCRDFCELRARSEADRELGEIYQQEYCWGETVCRSVACWQVVVQIGLPGGMVAEHDGLSLVGPGEAELDALARYAASRLDKLPEDQ